MYTPNSLLDDAKNALQEIMQNDSVQVEHIVIYFNRGMLLIREKPFTEQNYEYLKEHADKNEIAIQADSQTILIKRTRLMSIYFFCIKLQIFAVAKSEKNNI